MDARALLDSAVADARRGWRCSLEDIVIAALVVLPFTGASAILIGSMTGLPSEALIVITGLLQVVATFWNAGWRARDGQPEPHEDK